jgi:hypothetical protein
LYKAVGWDQATQTYTGKTEPVNGYVFITPDFVYFNHAQHVTVAGIECQTCHGPVETMKFKNNLLQQWDGVLIVTENRS